MEGATSQAAEETVARSAFYSFAAQMTTAAFTAALTLYLVRVLGPRSFGTFSLAISVGVLLLLPSDFGVTQSSSVFIAERRGDLAAVARLMADALRLKLVISGVLSAGLIALAAPIAHLYHQPALTWPLRWVAIAVLGQSMMGFYRYAYNSLRRLSLAFRIVLCESAAETGLSIMLVALGTGAAGAAAGRAAGYTVGLTASLLVTARLFGRRAFVRAGGGEQGTTRSLVSYGGALFVIDAAFAINAALAPLLIGAFLTARAVGIYQAPSRLLVFLAYPGLSLANAVTPRLARHRDDPPDKRAFEATLQRLIVFQALTIGPVIAWAHPISRLLFGAAYGGSAGVLRGLAPYIFLAGLSPVVSLGVNYLGRARMRLPIAFAMLAAETALDAALLPTIGLHGAVIGTDVGAALYVPLHFWLCKRMLGMRLRPFGLTLVRSLAAAAAMGGVLAAFGTGQLSIVDWVAGAVLGLAAFTGVLVASGQVSRAELAALARVPLQLRAALSRRR